MHPQLRPIMQLGPLGASVADVPGVGAFCSTLPRAAPHPTIKTNRPALARRATSDLPMFVITSNCRRAGRPMQHKRSTQAHRARCNRQGLRSKGYLIGAAHSVDRAGQPGFGASMPRPWAADSPSLVCVSFVCLRFNSSSIGSNRRIPLSFKGFRVGFRVGKIVVGMERDVRHRGLIAHEKNSRTARMESPSPLRR